MIKNFEVGKIYVLTKENFDKFKREHNIDGININNRKVLDLLSDHKPRRCTKLGPYECDALLIGLIVDSSWYRSNGTICFGFIKDYIEEAETPYVQEEMEL